VTSSVTLSSSRRRILVWQTFLSLLPSESRYMFQSVAKGLSVGACQFERSILSVGAWGSVVVTSGCATSRTVPESFPGGVTGDFFRGSFRQNHVPWVPGISPGVKAAGACDWRSTTLVVPNVEMIWGLNLPGTPRTTSACRGTPFLYFLSAIYWNTRRWIFLSHVAQHAAYSFQSTLKSLLVQCCVHFKLVTPPKILKLWSNVDYFCDDWN
jgi:hypothetical protein